MVAEVGVVTGATRGVGRAIATELARRGARVVICGRVVDAGRRVADEITGFGAVAVFEPVELEDGTSVRSLVDRVVRRFGRIDMVVSSAGLPPVAQGYFGTFDISVAGRQVCRTLQVKLDPVLACLPYSKESDAASVLLVTSEGGASPRQGNLPGSSDIGWG